jgi:hypothetical protein
MKDSTKYVGLDVSKDFVTAVAIADEGRDNPRYFGQIPNNEESIRKLFKNYVKRNADLMSATKLGQLVMGYIGSLLR